LEERIRATETNAGKVSKSINEITGCAGVKRGNLYTEQDQIKREFLLV